MTATISRNDFAVPTFPRELALRAHSGTSMVPDQRAEQGEAEYLAHLNSLYERVAPLAETDEQRTVLLEQMATYATGYHSRLTAMLGAQSRTYSTFIAGSSNYPARQMQKRFATVDKRREELLDWDNAARRRVEAAIVKARTPEQAELAGWAVLRREIDRDMATAIGIDEGTLPYTRSAFTTSVTGKLARLSKNGQHNLVVRALDHITWKQDSWAARGGKPFLAARNGVWALRAVAEAALAAAAAPATEETATEIENAIIAAGDGWAIVKNREIDRVQIVFDGKPDEATRAKLRGAGWNWSPNNVAWQRKLTNAAEYSARYIMGATS